MKYIYLIGAGTFVSLVHLYIVLRHRQHKKHTLSEHVAIDSETHLLYFTTHLICNVFFVLFAYTFYFVEQSLLLPYYLILVFVVVDLIQAALPSKGKTKTTHLFAAYISWASYLSSGLIAFFMLNINQPYYITASSLLVLLAVVVAFMIRSNENKYRYQLVTVPLFIIYTLIITIGAST